MLFGYSRKKNKAISVIGSSAILVLLVVSVVLGVYTIHISNANNGRISFQNLAGSSTPYADSSTSVNTQVSSTCIAQTTTATETASQCKVLTTMAPKGASMASFSPSGYVFTGEYNFTTSTVANNFTLKGNFISLGYFYLTAFCYNPSTIEKIGYANSTLQTNGTYALNLNLTVPIEPANEQCNYNVYVNSYPSGDLVNVTSNFVMITCAPAQLVENHSFYQSG